MTPVVQLFPEASVAGATAQVFCTRLKGGVAVRTSPLAEPAAGLAAFGQHFRRGTIAGA